MHPISWLRPPAVNCFMCDPFYLAAMQPEIGQFTRAQVRQLPDGSAVEAMILKAPHCRVEPRAQVVSQNVQGRAAYLYRIRHRHILSDIFVCKSASVRYTLC